MVGDRALSKIEGGGGGWGGARDAEGTTRRHEDRNHAEQAAEAEREGPLETRGKEEQTCVFIYRTGGRQTARPQLRARRAGGSPLCSNAAVETAR